MTRIILTAITCLLAATTSAQPPTWVWAKAAGGARTDNSFGIAAHRSGATYVTGTFGNDSSITFGATTLANAGAYDVFIAKYDAAGTVLWARSAGGPGYDGGQAVAVDSAGACYVTGSFENTISFGTVTLTSAGASDVFVAKYDVSGTLLWARRAGSSVIDAGASIAVDRTGNSYVTGIYAGTFTYGSTPLTNSGSDDFFVAKYDPSGAVVWAKGYGGAFQDQATDIATNRAGDVFVTGWYGSAGLTFGGGATVTNAGQNDVFIVRLDPAGAAVWAAGGGGPGNDQSLSIAVDGSSNSYITGRFTASPITFGTTTLPNAGGQDVFIAKYSAAGSPLWARRAGGADSELGHAIAADSAGYSFTTGAFLSPGISFGGQALTNAGTWPYSDLFVSIHDPSGTPVWAASAGASGTDAGYSIAVDGSGNSYLTGTFNTPITFGATTLNAAGASDLFVVKLAAGELSQGVEGLGVARYYTIFPNPASGLLHISPGDAGAGPQPFQVFDWAGRLVTSGEVWGRGASVNVEGWPAGVYGVRIGGAWWPVVKR